MARSAWTAKIKANASKHHALSYAHAGRIKAKLRREIARLMKLAQAAENEAEPEMDIPDEINTAVLGITVL